MSNSPFRGDEIVVRDLTGTIVFGTVTWVDSRRGARSTWISVAPEGGGLTIHVPADRMIPAEALSADPGAERRVLDSLARTRRTARRSPAHRRIYGR